MTYEPKTYWENRGRDYSIHSKPVRGEFKNLASWIRELKLDDILEVGAGWGRVYSYLEPLGLTTGFEMCDFVDSMREGCQERTGILPDYWDGETLPYPDRSFDLVMTFSTLRHVPPEDVERVVSEMARVTKRYLLVVEWWYGQPSCSFYHDYPVLFGRLGFEAIREARFRGGMRRHLLMVSVAEQATPCTDKPACAGKHALSKQACLGRQARRGRRS